MTSRRGGGRGANARTDVAYTMRHVGAYLTVTARGAVRVVVQSNRDAMGAVRQMIRSAVNAGSWGGVHCPRVLSSCQHTVAPHLHEWKALLAWACIPTTG